MNARMLTLALLVCLPVVARAADSIVLHEGKPVSGTLVEMHAEEVIIDTDPIKRTVAVSDISHIIFDDEPTEMKQVRRLTDAGQLDDAKATLEKIDPNELKRKEVAQEVAWYKAYVEARLAIGGSGSKNNAGKLLLAFEKANPDHYRYLQTCELIGDLLVSMNRSTQADAYYKKLASAKAEKFQARAALLSGRALQAAGKHAEAIAQFDQALAKKLEGADAAAQRMTVSLDKAVSLAATKKSAEGIKMVEEVIKQAPDENLELHARAYNALGNCYLAAGQKKSALIAFLHVDLLFSGFAEQHAEALYHLATLWRDEEKAERGKQAADQLKREYPGSRWSSK